MIQNEDALLKLASRQHGLISLEQARRLGVTQDQIQDRVSKRRWARLHPRVYRVGGAPLSWRQRMQAASLWAGADGALSHGAAAAVWGFDTFRDAPAELVMWRDRRLNGVTTHHAPSIAPDDVVTRQGLRVTSIPRTLLDLAARPHHRARAAINEALRRRWLTTAGLRTLVARFERLPGVDLLREVLHESDGGDGPTESQLEDLVWEILSFELLPRPRKQEVIAVNGKVRRVDFRFEGTPLVLEADGYAWHATIDAFERDRERHNELTRRGLRVIRWTWRAMSERGPELARDLRELLASCGR